jgi:hypothetical protein
MVDIIRRAISVSIANLVEHDRATFKLSLTNKMLFMLFFHYLLKKKKKTKKKKGSDGYKIYVIFLLSFFEQECVFSVR